jgi:hypothetical protein
MAATPTQLLRARQAFLEVPDDLKEEAYLEALKGICKLMNTPQPIPGMIPAAVLDKLALNFVPGPLAEGQHPGPAPQPLRSLIRDVLSIFVPRGNGVPGMAQAALGAAVNVETAETKKLEITHQWLGAVAQVDQAGTAAAVRRSAQFVPAAAADRALVALARREETSVSSHRLRQLEDDDDDVTPGQQMQLARLPRYRWPARHADAAALRRALCAVADAAADFASRGCVRWVAELRAAFVVRRIVLAMADAQVLATLVEAGDAATGHCLAAGLELSQHGIQVPRIRCNPQPPHNALYPQRWIALLITPPNTPTSVFEKWSTQMALLLDPGAVYDVYQPRHSHLLATMEHWFSLVPVGTTPETITYALLRLFFTTIEQFLEMIILTGKNSASATVATTKLNSLLKMMWHNNDTLNYFSFLEQAKNAKPESTTRPPLHAFRGRGMPPG